MYRKPSPMENGKGGWIRTVKHWISPQKTVMNALAYGNMLSTPPIPHRINPNPAVIQGVSTENKHFVEAVWQRYLEPLGIPAVPPMQRGTYGIIYKIPYNAQVARALKKLQTTLLNPIIGTTPLPPVGSVKHLILKFDLQYQETVKRFIRRTARESSVHEYIYNACIPEFGVCGSSFTVPFYFSGMISWGTVYMTCMGYSEGQQLETYLRSKNRRKISKPEFDAVETAVRSMLLLGIVHADLHTNNILISKEKNAFKVTIIDFGLAFQLPPRIYTKVIEVLKSSGGNLDAAWHQSGLQRFANAKMLKRGFDWYNPNIKTMRYLHSYLNKENSSKPKTPKPKTPKPKTPKPKTPKPRKPWWTALFGKGRRKNTV